MASGLERSTRIYRETGFTLLELAISLAVIALILGSALVGTALASQARLRSLSQDHAGLIAAIHMYRDRYAALPGDDPKAATRWPNSRNGNGDGVISGQYDDAPPADLSTFSADATSGETLLFWRHLRLAGLIAGPISGPGAVAPPTRVTAGRIGVEDGYMGLAGLALCMEGVTSKLASGLEIQIDDGNADTGIVRSIALALDGSATNMPSGRYDEAGTATYVVCMSLASASGAATGTENGKGKGNGRGRGNRNGNGNGNGNGIGQ